MRQKALRIVDYLAHIFDSIEQINSYVKNINEVKFINNRLIHDAVIKNIGEAGNNLLKRFPDFSTLVGGDTTTFVRAYEMRNFVAH